MARLAWTGISALWLAAALTVAVILATHEGGSAAVSSADGATERTYTFVAFVSPHTADLLADPPEDTRIRFEYVDSAQAALERLAAPEITA